MAPRRRSAVHSASRSRESELLARSRALADDPSPITPICEGDCVLFSPIKSAQRALPKVHAARDDEAKLNRMARQGNQLARAYAATLLIAHERVVSAYRASLGGWRTQLRVVLTGLAVLGLGLSATALAWVVYLGYVATTARGTPLAVPAALQVGMAAFGVILVVLVAVLAIGFAAASWRLGDLLFRVRALSRYHADVPAPIVVVIGATILYVVWQIPAIGPIAGMLVITYALGAVVTARLLSGGTPA